MSQPKHYRKIPDSILSKVGKLRSDNVVAGCVRKIPAKAIRNGDYAHLGISWKNGAPQAPKSIVPSVDTGTYSKLNVEGEEIVRRDLPMETRYNTVESPDWGDWSKGSHDVELPYQRYPREHVPPSENEISIEVLGKETEDEDIFVIRFVVSEVMGRAKRNFKNRLLFNLNLLLENAGAADVFSSDAAFDEYMKSVYVNWEILPPGQRDANIARILKAVRDTPEIRARIADRYSFLEGLGPEHFIQGLGGFKRYFGAQFSEDLVVFENMEYGNAIYVMFANWAVQSQKSRQQLLDSGREGKDFIRIPHRSRWKSEVKQIISQYRNNSK